MVSLDVSLPDRSSSRNLPVILLHHHRVPFFFRFAFLRNGYALEVQEEEEDEKKEKNCEGMQKTMESTVLWNMNF